jgi:hypothetical protein
MTDYSKLMDEAVAKAGLASCEKRGGKCEIRGGDNPPRPPYFALNSHLFREQVIDNRLNSLNSLISHPPSLSDEAKNEKSKDFSDRSAERSPRGEISELSELSPLAAAFSAFAQACPEGVDNSRYVEALADAELFLSQWGAQAQALGWRAEDLFSLDPVAPLARYDRMGLVWLLRGREVVALTAATATMRTPSEEVMRKAKYPKNIIRGTTTFYRLAPGGEEMIRVRGD